MEPTILAKVSINIGMGKSNPHLIIHQNEDVSELVHKLISNYSLPKKVYELIMSKVVEELGEDVVYKKENTQKAMHRDASNKSLSKSKRAERSPFQQKKANHQHSQKKTPSKNVREKTPVKTRTPVKPPTLRSPNIIPRKSSKTIHPPPRSRTPIPQKENRSSNKLDTSKSRNKSQSKLDKLPPKVTSPRKAVNEEEKNIRRLFKHLTAKNPENTSVLSPEHINLGGLHRDLLAELQLFFEEIEENKFDNMTEEYFVDKVTQLKYGNRLGCSRYYS